jgi:hypothetical protein
MAGAERLGDQEAEEGIAVELERLVVGAAAEVMRVRRMGQRAPQMIRIAEEVAETLFQRRPRWTRDCGASLLNR